MTEYFFHAAANKDKSALFAALKYLTVIVFFALGVICGCYTCWQFDRYAILFMSALALLIIIYMLVLRLVHNKALKRAVVTAEDNSSRE